MSASNPTGQYVPNYLVQSILVTIFCCLPFGIVSIINAAQVNGKLSAGDLNGAMASSANAKKWSWIAFGVGLVINIIVIITQVVLVGSQLSQSGHLGN